MNVSDVIYVTSYIVLHINVCVNRGIESSANNVPRFGNREQKLNRKEIE